MRKASGRPWVASNAARGTPTASVNASSQCTSAGSPCVCQAASVDSRGPPGASGTRSGLPNSNVSR